MVYRSKRLTINNTFFTAWTDTYRTGEATILLTDFSGWDETPSIVRNRAPYLFKDGEMQSTAAKYKGREMSFSFQASYPETIGIRALRSAVITLANNINTEHTFAMTYYEDGEEVFKEILKARVGDDFFEEWKEYDNSVDFTLSFVASDPWKTVYLNGSTTPQANKRL
jgi:hypothetical protein